MDKNTPYSIDLSGVEDVMKKVGFADGMPLLDKRILDSVKQNDVAVKRFIRSMKAKYTQLKNALAPASPQNLAKKGAAVTDISPASANNKPKEAKVLDYKTPAIELKNILNKGHWFDEVCIDKEKYDVDWVNNFIDALMDSELREVIAEGWSKRQGLKIMGAILGLLLDNHLFKPRQRNLTIAKQITGANKYFANEKLQTDSGTLAKYMGDDEYKKTFADWTRQYIENQA